MFEEMMPFLTALVIGLLVGIERERSKSRQGEKAVFGVRTFPLIAFLGVISAHIGSESLLVITGIFVCVLVLANHLHWIKDINPDISKVGATTAVAVVLTFLLGYLANSNGHMALILTVMVFGFLAIKKYLHSFAQSGITDKEMNAVLTFLVSAFVILPILPNKFVDPWNLVHPTRIWILFVIIAAIEFASYIALRQIGQKLGLLVIGLFGGFASATATTLTLARRAKDQSKSILLIASGIVLADVSSLLMQMVVLMVIAPEVSAFLMPLLGIPAIVGGLIALLVSLYLGQKVQQSTIEVNIENPISLKSTISFALMISVGLILIALSQRWFGDVGLYLTSALGGATSLRAVTFSVSELAASGEILMSVASIAIIIAMAANMSMKLILILRAGGAKLFMICSLSFAAILASSVAVYLFYV
jgi:uncharacterized membrane protein (DUF4010 family)